MSNGRPATRRFGAGTGYWAEGRRRRDSVVQPGDETELDAIFALECASFEADRLSRRGLRRFLTRGIGR